MVLAAAAEPAAGGEVLVLHDCHPPCPVMLRFTLCAVKPMLPRKSQRVWKCANAQNERHAVAAAHYSQANAPSSHVKEGVCAEHRCG